MAVPGNLDMVTKLAKLIFTDLQFTMIAMRQKVV